MGLIERIGSDYAYLTGVLRSLAKISKVVKNPGRTYPQVVRDLAAALWRQGRADLRARADDLPRL